MTTQRRVLPEDFLFDMQRDNATLIYLVELFYDRVQSANLISEELRQAFNQWTLDGTMTRTRGAGFWLLADTDATAGKALISITLDVDDDHKEHTFSVDVAQPSSGAALVTRLRVRLSGGTASDAQYDYTWATGVLSTVVAGVRASAISLGNGRTRLSITVKNNGSGNTDAAISVYPAGGGTETGDIEVYGDARLTKLGVSAREVLSTGDAVVFNGITAIEGGAKTNPASFSLNGGQGTQVELFNYADNAIVDAAILGGINNVPVKIWVTYLGPTGVMRRPVLYVKGVLDGANMDEDRVMSEVRLTSVINDILPRDTYTYSDGFEHLPPIGTRIVWEGQTFQL